MFFERTKSSTCRTANWANAQGTWAFSVNGDDFFWHHPLVADLKPMIPKGSPLRPVVFFSARCSKVVISKRQVENKRIRPAKIAAQSEKIALLKTRRGNELCKEHTGVLFEYKFPANTSSSHLPTALLFLVTYQDFQRPLPKAACDELWAGQPPRDRPIL